MVLFRIVAVGATLIGIAMVAFSTYGIAEGQDFAQNLASLQRTQNVILDPENFEFRWKAMCSIVGVAGIALLISGLALWRNRRWALLTIAAAAVALAAYPWALRVFGLTRYGFEVAESLDTTVLMAIAVLLATIFFRRGSRLAA